MLPDENPHHRRSVRIPAFDYAASGAYFVTLVTYARAQLFGKLAGEEMQLSAIGEFAQGCWREIPEHFSNAELGAFVIMPNHVHGIIILHERAERAAISSPPVGAQHAAPLRPRVEPGSLGAIVRSYKSAVTRAIGLQFGGTRHIWQRSYYEHVIRDDEDWSRIHLYIEDNILNWAQDEENQTGR